MTDVVLFHHVQGLTEGVRAFADQLRVGGHEVHTPDLFDGALPATIDEGIALTRSIGDDELDRRTDAAVADLPRGLVYAGFSVGAATAQRLAQTRPGALGALLFESCVSLTAEWSFGPWPQDVPVQVHGMDADPFFALEGDLDAARELVEQLGPDRAELFLYPGDRHLFADSSLASYDEAATALLVQRSRDFLDRVG
jgi:dienelactone hydrolase